MKIITQSKIYDDLKDLFNVDDESFEIFFNIKGHLVKDKKINNILYLSINYELKNIAFKRFISKNNISYNQINFNSFTINYPNGCIHFLCVDELKKIEGTRFKRVYFTN